MCPFSILTKTPSTCTVLSASLLFLTFSCLFLCFPTTIFYYFCSFHFKTFPKLFCNLLQLRTNFPFWLSFSSLLSVETFFFFFFFFLTYLRISYGFSSLLVSQWETLRSLEILLGLRVVGPMMVWTLLLINRISPHRVVMIWKRLLRDMVHCLKLILTHCA